MDDPDQTASDPWSSLDNNEYTRGFYVRVGLNSPLQHVVGDDPRQAIANYLDHGASLRDWDRIWVWRVAQIRQDLDQVESVESLGPVGEPRVFVFRLGLRELEATLPVDEIRSGSATELPEGADRIVCPGCNKVRPEYSREYSPEKFQALLDEYWPCCNPQCNGRRGTGCHHCHHPKFWTGAADDPLRPSRQEFVCIVEHLRTTGAKSAVLFAVQATTTDAKSPRQAFVLDDGRVCAFYSDVPPALYESLDLAVNDHPDTVWESTHVKLIIDHSMVDRPATDWGKTLASQVWPNEEAKERDKQAIFDGWAEADRSRNHPTDSRALSGIVCPECRRVPPHRGADASVASRYGKCCNPECHGRLNAGCYHCHLGEAEPEVTETAVKDPLPPGHPLPADRFGGSREQVTDSGPVEDPLPPGHPLPADRFSDPYGHVGDSASIEPVVHVLVGGAPLCDFMSGETPGDWPDGHTWCRIEQAPVESTCLACADEAVLRGLAPTTSDGVVLVAGDRRVWLAKDHDPKAENGIYEVTETGQSATSPSDGKAEGVSGHPDPTGTFRPGGSRRVGGHAARVRDEVRRLETMPPEAFRKVALSTFLAMWDAVDDLADVAIELHPADLLQQHLQRGNIRKDGNW